MSDDRIEESLGVGVGLSLEAYIGQTLAVPDSEAALFLSPATIKELLGWPSVKCINPRNTEMLPHVALDQAPEPPKAEWLGQ